MKSPVLGLRSPVLAFIPLVLLAPSCSNSGWDPTANMGKPGGGDEVKFIARSDGTVDIGALGALSKYIRGQRHLNRSEEQILESLVQKEIGGYRFERLRVLEQKKAATTKRHEVKRAESNAKHQAKIERIRKSPAPDKSSQIEVAEREHESETKQAEAEVKRELVLIDTEIKREKSKTYVVPVRDPQNPKNRSVVLIDTNNRVKGSKVYQVDRSMVDLAKVASREDPDVAVLTNVAPLQLPGGP